MYAFQLFQREKNKSVNLTNKSVSSLMNSILFLSSVTEDSQASESQPDNTAAVGDSWALPEITGRSIIPMASEEELEELQEMVDELLNSDGTDGQSGQGMVSTF